LRDLFFIRLTNHFTHSPTIDCIFIGYNK